MSDKLQQKLLIVDDEKDIRDLCTAIIKRFFDIEILTAGSLKEATEIVEQQAIDFAILDLHLPDGVGFDIVPFLKKSNPKLKFLIVTAYNHCDEKRKADELGAESLLAKPFKSADLKMEIEQMLTRVNA